MITAQQIQRIYGMGATLGLVESGNKEDLLHELIYCHTEKTSVRELTNEEYKAIVKELAERIQIANLQPPHPAKQKRAQKYETTPGGMTAGQQKKVWALMYQLQGCDLQDSPSSLGERLCGIIKKELNIDCTPKNPLKWIKYQQGNKLIELLKNYVKSAERKAKRGRE